MNIELSGYFEAQLKLYIDITVESDLSLNNLPGSFMVDKLTT